MNHAKLLDCTLRDGGYLVDKKFGNTAIKGIIDGLIEARIDYIEIGFFQNDGFGEGKTVFRNSKDARRFIPADKAGCQFTVLADYSRYSLDNLDEHTECSVDAIRECFFKKERYDAIPACRVIKDKGYKLFIQPVDILGYSDIELLEFLEMVNEVEPYCLSIVDTFGSMYQEDLHRIFELIHHNLSPSIKLGFHSHNNMQLSNALSQEFVRMTVGKRDVIVDCTISGMGRGAGNTPTELIAQYMTSQLGYTYSMDALLDTIDSFMGNIQARCSWGYSTPYFLAGCYSAHVNNISFLLGKNSLRSKDIRYILNKIDADTRKRYDYELLEKTYLELLKADIDDSATLERLKTDIGERPILILVPGNTISSYENQIKEYIKREHPITISVNFIHDTLEADYVYMSNVKRYQYWKNNNDFFRAKKILTSNVVESSTEKEVAIVSVIKLIKCGWEHIDNSTVMLLRLLDIICVSHITIAGFDGYKYDKEKQQNYISTYLELPEAVVNPAMINNEIEEMLRDFNITRTHKDVLVEFITPSRFSKCFQ